jgi:eukaryotic-like serine/threonine-protein kinase
MGNVVGRYKVLTKLGEGGMGQVFLARDVALDRNIALKFLSPSLQSDATARARFVQEARAAAAIDHPYVCKVFEAGEIDGRAFIAMEYLEGSTLDARLRSGPMEWTEARRLILEVGEALIKAHSKGIVHRDLKPSNIMQTTDGHIRVLDFGLAKRFQALDNETLTIADHTDAGTVVGTVRYMSPEQLRGLRVDARSDLFSLGIVLYELLTNVHPFKKASMMETAQAVFHEELGPVSRYNKTCPPDVDRILARMCGKDPSDRYPSVQEFYDHLLGTDQRAPIAAADTSRALARSIAVLPFINMSPDPEQEYFSDGITEDIISQLSKLPGLKVIARTSVMRLKNTSKELSVIGRELGVKNIVEGSVRHSGSRVRITCGLVEAQTSEQLWSDVYDRDLTDIFAIQLEVAAQIASALSSTLSISTSVAAATREAGVQNYHLYLKARHFLNTATPDGITKAIGYFQQALAADPTDARSYAGLSTAYAVAGHWDFMPPQEAFSKSRSAAKAALDFDSRLAEAYTSLGLAMFHDWDWQGCEKNFTRAIELNANSVDARVFYSWYLCMAGRLEEGLQETQRALDLDPLSSFVRAIHSWALILIGRFEEAILHLEHILAIDPAFIMAHAELGHAYAGMGRYDEAIASIEKGGWRKMLPVITYALAGRINEARGFIDNLLKSAQVERERPSEIAYACVLVGERERAAAWFEKAIEERDYMGAMHFAANWAAGRDDKMVQDYIRRMGLLP